MFAKMFVLKKCKEVNDEKLYILNENFENVTSKVRFC